MPQILKSAKDGQIAVKALYTAGDLAFLMGVAHATAIRLIDQREIGGFWLPTKRRQRRVTHEALIAFVRRNPDFRYMLDKLKGYDPHVDFPVGTEPPPPARPIGSAAPRSPEHPRTAYRGQIPLAESYSTKEVAFLLGISRRYVVKKLNARIIPGIKVPATRADLFTTWKWRIMHGAFVAFVQQHPRFSYALDRIRGYGAGGAQDDCPARKEPLIAPGAPGWRGRPHQTRRGGFKRGPKLPDGRQPSKTREDVAATAEANRKPLADSSRAER
ncbi:MAG: hypothetical protein ACLQU5_19610 [Isosphaeraceae bacterium]